jgi:hypothetical protein
VWQAERDESGVFWNASNDILTGIAGIGLALLEMHYAEIGERSRVRFPDDPFPARR